MKLVNLLHYVFSKNNDDNRFIITSHGQTATRWLANALNTHPKIFCTHGYTYPPQAPDSHELTHEEKVKIAETSTQRFWKLSIHDFFYELKTCTSKKYIGNVHGYMYGYLMDSLRPWQLFNVKESLQIINMVRHPITRIESAYRCWSAGQPDTSSSSFVDNDFNHRCDDIIKHISQKHNLKFSAAERFFIVALLQARDIAKDVKRAIQDNTHQITFEEITTDIEAIKTTVKFITRGAIQLSTKNAEDMLKTNPLNKHNNERKATAKAQFEAWQPWQQDGFKFICEEDNLQELYAGFDYDFSFIT